MCDTNPLSPAREYLWKGFSNHDSALLKNIQEDIWKDVPADVIDGAANPNFVDCGPKTETVVLEYDKVCCMFASEVQELFEKCNVIIRNVPAKEHAWDWAALMAITGGEMTRKCDIQSEKNMFITNDAST